MRLVEGDADGRNGVVEVAFNGRWGTICEDSSWGVEGAAIVCDQLGLDSDSEPTVLYSGYVNTAPEGPTLCARDTKPRVKGQVAQ